MKVKDFSKLNLKEITADIEKALESVATKYGVSIKSGKGKYSETHFNLEIELSVISKDGQALSKEVTDFKRYAELLGMSEKDLGKEFKVNEKTFILYGFSPQSRKYPLIATNLEDGKNYKFEVERVKQLLG